MKNCPLALLLTLALITPALPADQTPDQKISSQDLQRHQDAIQEITRPQMNGKYYPKFQKWVNHPRHCDLERWKGTDYTLINDLQGLEMLWLPSTVTDENLEEINTPNLKLLRLRGDDFTNEGFVSLITRLPRLKRITLIDAPGINDKGLACLTNLQHLKNVELVRVPKTTDAGVQALPTRLHMLNIRGAKISSGCCEHISKMQNMAFLYIHDTTNNITDRDIQKLAKLKKLQVLSLNTSHLTSNGLQAISKLSNLEVLRFGGSSITNEDLKLLKNLQHLRSLIVIDTQCTQAGLNQLRLSIWGTEQNAKENRVRFSLK